MPVDVDVVGGGGGGGGGDCEMAEADEDAVNRAFPLPDSAMEAWTTNM